MKWLEFSLVFMVLFFLTVVTKEAGVPADLTIVLAFLFGVALYSCE